MIFGYLILIVFFSFLLIKATDILVVNLKSLSQKTRVGQFAIAGFIIALGTSLPELAVSLAAAFRQDTVLALGNVIGSNIANLSLIIGGAAVIGGTVHVSGRFLAQDAFYTFLAGSAVMVLLFDKYLSRLDGLILLLVYGFYQLVVIGQQNKKGEAEQDGLIYRLIRHFNHRAARHEAYWLVLGLFLLLVSAEFLVVLAEKVALILNMPLILMGLIIVAVGTSLPELAFETKAIRSRQPQLVFGDLFGSVVANGTLIIGLSALISPMRINGFAGYLLATMAFVIIFGIFYLFIRTKHRLERWEGVVLIILYLIFAVMELVS